MTRLNPSPIALGALVALLYIFTQDMSARIEYARFPLDVLLLFTVVAILLTSVERYSIDYLANLGFGIFAFLFAFRLPQVQHMFTDGSIAYVGLSLFLAGIYLRRPR